MQDIEAGQTWVPENKRSGSRRVIAIERGPPGVLIAYYDTGIGAEHRVTEDMFQRWAERERATVHAG